MANARVNAETLKRVARNARLNISDDEVWEFLPKLNEVLEKFSVLGKMKVEKVKPSFQPVELSNVLREDNALECLTQEEALSNTKHKKYGYFRGPKIIQ